MPLHTVNSAPRRCATRVAAFVLIVRRMIHGALWYGDHPRNILSSRYQPYTTAESLSPTPREARGHRGRLETTEIRRMKGALCSPAKVQTRVHGELDEKRDDAGNPKVTICTQLPLERFNEELDNLGLAQTSRFCF